MTKKKIDRKKLGKTSRRKGHQFERDIANELQEIFPEARRHLENHIADAKGYDLDNTGVFRIQCKRRKTYAPITTIKEVDCEFFEIPIVITKADKEDTMVVMKFEHWKEIVKGYMNAK